MGSKRAGNAADKGGPRLRNSVPTSHLRLMAEIAADRGVPVGQLLAGTGITADMLDQHDLRVPPREAVRFVFNTITLAKVPGLGLEFGLRSRPTLHGPVGLAVLSCATLYEALQLLVRFVHLREQDVSLALYVEGPHIVMQATDNHDLGPARQIFHECMMVGFFRMCGFLIGEERPECEIWFDWPEPAYFPPYRERLPAVRYQMPFVQLRFPLRYLDRKLVMSDPGAVKKAVAECEREMALLGRAPQDLVGRVRAELQPGTDGYPDLETVSARLFMSSRTLKRKLEHQRTSFQVLLDEARQRDAQRMLANPDLDIQHIAIALGYTDPPSFTRAFRRWTGKAPSEARPRGSR
jgi:AraC-like DNA-binding protein